MRFIGVTGHGLSVPEMHRRSLERFAFDSVLCPYNYVQMQDPRYAETFEALAARLRRAQRRAADDQEPRLAAAGTAATAHRLDLVRAAARAGRHRPRRALGARPPGGRSCSPPATSRSCRGCSTRPSASRSARPTSRWPSSPRARARAAVRLRVEGQPGGRAGRPRDPGAMPAWTGSTSRASCGHRRSRDRGPARPGGGDGHPAGARARDHGRRGGLLLQPTASRCSAASGSIGPWPTSGTSWTGPYRRRRGRTSSG